jgi:hypothetical protein
MQQILVMFFHLFPGKVCGTIFSEKGLGGIGTRGIV